MFGQFSVRLIATVVALSVSFAVLRAEDETGVRRVLIVCGHPGDEAHHKLFAETIDRLTQGLIKNLDVAPERIHVQFGAEPLSEDPPVVTSARGMSTREEIAVNVADIQAELQPDDSLWVIVMGHAHFDGRNAHFNLPGPDYRSDEFAKLFINVSCREQVFFITCPVSGYFIKPLTAPFRVVMTATEVDLEFNETNCVEALADVLFNPPHRAAFDVDQDGELTLFDLYIVLVRRVIAAPLLLFSIRNWIPVASITRPISPPSASISRTIWPLATPPIAGLQLICPTLSQFIVSKTALAPRRAAANAASHPACPAPITATSKS